MASIEQKTISKILKESNLYDVYALNVKSSLFVQNRQLFSFICDFYSKHGQMPSSDVTDVYFPEFSLIDETPDPLSFYVEELRKARTYTILSDAVDKTTKHLFDLEVDPAVKLLQNSILQVETEVGDNKVASYVQSAKTRLDQMYAKMQFKEQEGLHFRWRTLQQETLGVQPSQLVGIVGRTGIGKTYFMCILAHDIRLTHRNVLFISMEMSENELYRRVDAIGSGISPKKLRSGMLAPDELTRYKTYLDDIDCHDGDIYVVDAGSVRGKMDLLAIEGLIQQYKPDCVIIDGVYLLHGPNPRAGRVEKMYDVVEGLKAAAKRHTVPILISAQMKRKEKGGLDNISWGDQVAQNSDLVLEIQENQAFPDVRSIRILKQREGERITVSSSWDMNKMEFKEVDLGGLEACTEDSDEDDDGLIGM